MKLVIVLLAAAAALAGAMAILGYSGAGAQPWSPELSDNFVFAKSIPFTLGLGVAAGLLRSSTIARWVFVLGLALALPTGLWQYLGGILDKELPVALYLIYRVHYIGGTLVLFAIAAVATTWWVAGDRSIWMPPPAKHLSDFLRALPGVLRVVIAQRLGRDVPTPAPGSPEFAYYEKVVTFPVWESTIALITITGLVKALRYVFPVPGPVLYVASTLHVAAMVLILIQLLDQFRYRFGPRPALAIFAVLWALGNLWLGYVFVSSAFLAKTAIKEGLPAQAALLLGGVIVATLAVLLILQGGRTILGRRAAG